MLEGVLPQGILLLSQDQEGDMLKLTRHVGQLGLLQRVRKRTVRFIEKYGSFLDGLVAPPTEVAMETIERYVHSINLDVYLSYVCLFLPMLKMCSTRNNFQHPFR